MSKSKEIKPEPINKDKKPDKKDNILFIHLIGDRDVEDFQNLSNDQVNVDFFHTGNPKDLKIIQRILYNGENPTGKKYTKIIIYGHGTHQGTRKKTSQAHYIDTELTDRSPLSPSFFKKIWPASKTEDILKRLEKTFKPDEIMVHSCYAGAIEKAKVPCTISALSSAKYPHWTNYGKNHIKWIISNYNKLKNPLKAFAQRSMSFPATTTLNYYDPKTRQSLTLKSIAPKHKEDIQNTQKFLENPQISFYNAQTPQKTNIGIFVENIKNAILYIYDTITRKSNQKTNPLKKNKLHQRKSIQMRSSKNDLELLKTVSDAIENEKKQTKLTKTQLSEYIAQRIYEYIGRRQYSLVQSATKEFERIIEYYKYAQENNLDMSIINNSMMIWSWNKINKENIKKSEKLTSFTHKNLGSRKLHSLELLDFVYKLHKKIDFNKELNAQEKLDMYFWGMLNTNHIRRNKPLFDKIFKDIKNALDTADEKTKTDIENKIDDIISTIAVLNTKYGKAYYTALAEYFKESNVELHKKYSNKCTLLDTDADIFAKIAQKQFADKNIIANALGKAIDRAQPKSLDQYCANLTNFCENNQYIKGYAYFIQYTHWKHPRKAIEWIKKLRTTKQFKAQKWFDKESSYNKKETIKTLFETVSKVNPQKKHTQDHYECAIEVCKEILTLTHDPAQKAEAEFKRYFYAGELRKRKHHNSQENFAENYKNCIENKILSKYKNNPEVASHLYQKASETFKAHGYDNLANYYLTKSKDKHKGII